MEGKENEYVRRTQKDCTMSFKMSVVREYEETDMSLAPCRENTGYRGATPCVSRSINLAPLTGKTRHYSLWEGQKTRSYWSCGRR